MFSLNYDFGALAGLYGTQWLTENIYMVILLWISHISALIIIQTALISLFGRKLVVNSKRLVVYLIEEDDDAEVLYKLVYSNIFVDIENEKAIGLLLYIDRETKLPKLINIHNFLACGQIDDFDFVVPVLCLKNHIHEECLHV